MFGSSLAPGCRQGCFLGAFLRRPVLNGHHPLEAYARLGLPVPVLIVARAADGAREVDQGTRWLREVFGPRSGRPAHSLNAALDRPRRLRAESG